ncbi:MAG: ferrochelatase [Pseudomonadales bacterium]|nr:ferrochelatase [Pseudomonadales bacterium]
MSNQATQSNPENFAVLLVNLGTPDAPTAVAVRRYLKEFLWDKRVVDAPRWLWWLILNGIILRFRPKKVAKLYQSVWMQQGSPLLHYSQSLAQKLEADLSDHYGQNVPVIPAMTYGNPSITAASSRLKKQGIKKLIVLPMYPQYSASTTAASFDALARQLLPCPDLPEVVFIRDYHCHPAYIDALKQSVLERSTDGQHVDKLIMSFHGIPLRYHQQGDPYPEECQATAQALADALGLTPTQWMLTFQSRFGREEWLQPYTDITMESLPQQGIKNIQVICPGFAVDCLETLEEIEEQNKDIFTDAGGQHFHYIPCLNDSAAHVNLLQRLVIEKALAFQKLEY